MIKIPIEFKEIAEFFNETIDLFMTNKLSRLVIDFATFDNRIINDFLDNIKGHYDIIKSHPDHKQFLLYPRPVKVCCC